MKVTFLGRVAPSEVNTYLQQARMLVHPSHLGDGLPNSILEAMSCGVPVIATRTSGMPDIVQHEETGFLFEPGDTTQLTRYIHRLNSDDQLWQQMGTRSMEAVQQYSWDKVVPQIEQLLSAACSKRPRPQLRSGQSSNMVVCHGKSE